MAITPRPLHFGNRVRSAISTGTAGGIVSYPGGTEQEILPAPERADAWYLKIDGSEYPVFLWRGFSFYEPEMPEFDTDEEYDDFILHYDDAWKEAFSGIISKMLAGDLPCLAYQIGESLSSSYSHTVEVNGDEKVFGCFGDRTPSGNFCEFDAVRYPLSGLNVGETRRLNSEFFPDGYEGIFDRYTIMRTENGAAAILLFQRYVSGGQTQIACTVREINAFLPDYYRRLHGIAETHTEDSGGRSDIYFLDAVNTYSYFGLDHPARGVWYGAAVLHRNSSGEDTLQLFRYRYEQRLDPMLLSGVCRAENGGIGTAAEFTVANRGADFFFSEASPAVPGTKLTFGVRAGNSAVYPVGTYYIDALDYDALSEKTVLHAKGVLAFRLAGQCFETARSYTGTISAAARRILSYFGIRNYRIEESNEIVSVNFPAGMTGLEALGILEETMTVIDGTILSSMWRAAEMPDGTVVCGYEPFLAEYLPTTYYQIAGAHEVFSCRVHRSAKDVYSRVRMEGKDAEDTYLVPEVIEVPHAKPWELGTHRVYHGTAVSVTQENLHQMALNNAFLLRYGGDVTKVKLNLQPQLLVGDYLNIRLPGGTARDIGVVTAIVHRFGEDGFYTEAEADSSGGIWHLEGGRLATRALPLARSRRREELRALLGTFN